MPFADEETDPIYWWSNQRQFRILPLMARDFLCIQPTSAPIEREFSKASDITNPPKRNRLTKKRINQLCCLKSWLRLKDQLEAAPKEDISDKSNFSGSESESGGENEN